MCVFMNSTLDPQMRWLLAVLRLWYLCSAERAGERGRLGVGAVNAFGWGITVSNEGFMIGARWVPVREEWFVIRKVATRHLKTEHARRLAERRPAIFGGLEGWNHKQHNKLLMSVFPYERMVLLKLWTGASMCHGEDATCACGVPDQSLRHLLWECPCFPPPPVSIEYRRHLPNSQAVAHLLPPMANRADVLLWKESCMRAVHIPAKTLMHRLVCL